MLDEIDKNLTLEDIENLRRALGRRRRSDRWVREDAPTRFGLRPDRGWRDYVRERGHCPNVEEMEAHISDERLKAERMHEAIEAARARGEISDFMAETYHLQVTREMTRKGTAWEMGSVGLTGDGIRNDVTEPWDAFIRKLGALDRHERKEDLEEEPEEEAPEVEDDDDYRCDSY